MDETLEQLIAAAQGRIADRPCPWCGAAAWSAGRIVLSTVVNQAGEPPMPSFLSVVFSCQSCRYQASFFVDDQ